MLSRATSHVDFLWRYSFFSLLCCADVGHLNHSRPGIHLSLLAGGSLARGKGGFDQLDSWTKIFSNSTLVSFLKISTGWSVLIKRYWPEVAFTLSLCLHAESSPWKPVLDFLEWFSGQCLPRAEAPPTKMDRHRGFWGRESCRVRSHVSRVQSSNFAITQLWE